MNTDRIYYEDCYLCSFDARIVDRGADDCRVYLDRTAFYPASGGQPHDTGMLGGERVIEVIDEGDRIVHRMARSVQTDLVKGEIDWERRYDHMQQHTGQHLLSAVLVELFGFETLSFHMGAEVSSIEVHTKALTESQIEQAEERANAITREARAVHILFEESGTIANLRKPSDRTGTLRVIEIEGLDRSACGGTHVRSTAEIGPIQIRKLEKIRGNVRIEFVCGNRAIRRAREDFRILTEASKLGATGLDEVPEYIAALRQKLADSEKARERIALELARLEADRLYESTPVSSDGIRRIMLRVEAIDEAVRSKLSAFVRNSKAVALAIGSEPPGVMVAASPDSGIDAGAVLKDVLSRFGGRGGGSQTRAQGKLPCTNAASALEAALEFSGGSSSALRPD